MVWRNRRLWLRLQLMRVEPTFAIRCRDLGQVTARPEPGFLPEDGASLCTIGFTAEGP